MKKVKHIYSKDKIYWQEGEIQNIEYEDTLEITYETKQTLKGLGGCFNEISWDILKKEADLYKYPTRNLDLR